MGIDMRVIPDDRVEQLVNALQSHGIDTTLIERTVVLTDEQCQHMNLDCVSAFVIREICCQRGECKLSLGIHPDLHSDSCFHIYIPNLYSWQPGRNKKLKQFQHDVTAVLESNGAYWPFD